MKCPKCNGTGEAIGASRIAGSTASATIKCPTCEGAGKVERSDGIDYDKKIAVPEHKAGQGGL